MILFAPAYDESTRATCRMAERFAEIASDGLFAGEASRLNLALALRSPEPLAAFTHGTRDALKGQDGEVALSAEDAGWIGARAVLAYACHTGTELGRVMAERGATWWGYTGAIAAPPDDPAHADLVAPAFEALVRHAVGGAGDVAPAEVPERLRLVCRGAEEALDVLMEAGAEVEMQAYQCLLHLWDRLRIWLPGGGEPVRHPAAAPLFLFD